MAQSTRDIRRRITSVKNTQQITKAMEMIAAAKLRKAQDRVSATRPYYHKLETSLGRVLQAARKEGEELPDIAKIRQGNRHCLVVITADRGLAGGYNAFVLRQAEEFLKENPDTQMVLIGRKARDYFRRREVQFLAEHVGLGDEISIRLAHDVGEMIYEFYVNNLYDRVSILYTKFINTVSQKVVLRQVLPIGETSLESPKAESELKPSYWYEPSLGEVLQVMVPLLIDAAIFQSLAEARASEQASRMNAMRSATDNAGELIKELNLSFNRARQATITKELSEIVGGADALES